MKKEKLAEKKWFGIICLKENLENIIKQYTVFYDEGNDEVPKKLYEWNEFFHIIITMFKVLSRTNFMNKFYKQIEKIDNEAILLSHCHWILKTY